MSIHIKKVTTKREMKQFIRFNFNLYRDNPYSVPDLADGMYDTFSKKNAAYEVCDVIYFLAYRENVVVGRIAGIINHKANEVWNQKKVRFGWIDFIDDIEVSTALLNAVEEWGREMGMQEIHGPMGFTDFDAEGMLVDGFNELSTMATIYNYPYYPKHIEKLGYNKDVDWIEFKIYIPNEIPEKHRRISEIVLKKYNLKFKKYTSRKLIAKEYGQQIFDLMNEAYASLYGFAPLTQKQIDQYIKMYLPLVDLRMVSLVVDEEDKLVAVGLSMPSLSEALKKAKGKLFPFGWYYLLKALFFKKRSKVLDLLLVAVKPEYQNKGVNALLFYDLIPAYQSLGFEYAESNPELEINDKVQAQWSYFKTENHKRRRAYTKKLTD